MIQVQISVGDLHKGDLGSDDVSWGHQQVSTNNSWLKRATDMGVISLCLSGQDALTDMQHDLLGRTCDLTWPDLRSNINLTIEGHQVHVSTRLDERNTMVPELGR